MTENIEIHVAASSEREALEALQWRASLNNPGDREALLAHPDAITVPATQIDAGHVFVARRGSELLGFAAVELRPDGGTELDGLFVEPSRWRHGIGRALVEYCCTFASARGSQALHVIGNPHARAFYEACGFVITGVEQTRFGKGLLMKKELRGPR